MEKFFGRNIKKQKNKGANGYECSSIAPLFIILLRQGGVGVRRYCLASLQHKENVDLRDYEDVIVNAVMAAMKDIEDVSVSVHEKYYEVSPSPGRGAAIAIGRAICKSGLGKCCVQIPKLFSSVEVCIDKEEKNDREKTDRMD